MKKQKQKFVQLETTDLPKKKIAFVGWKKVYLMNTKGDIIGDAIVKLHVPASADRIQADRERECSVDANIKRKIRVSEAKVMEVIPFNLKSYFINFGSPNSYTRKYKVIKNTKAVSTFDYSFKYKKGKILKEFLDPRNIACASGIHCFTLRSSAESYLR